MTLPDRCEVVVVGGGVIGCSIAYHLAKLGITDVLLLERRQLTCGTTWHAAGLVPQLRATRTLTELAKYTSELLKTLETETGQATGFRQNGSVAASALAMTGAVATVAEATSAMATRKRTPPCIGPPIAADASDPRAFQAPAAASPASRPNTRIGPSVPPAPA